MDLWILLMLIGSTWADYYGITKTYFSIPYGGPNATSHLVEELSVQTSDTCVVFNWTCSSGDCGELTSSSSERLDSQTETVCQMKTITNLQVPSQNFTFEMRMDGGTQNWVQNINKAQLIRAMTVVQMGFQHATYGSSENSQPPHAAMISPLRIPSNCPKPIPLSAYDPNTDQVVCRYGTPPYECDPCSPPSFLYVSPTCTLLLNLTSDNEGVYAVELVMEDYPRRNTTFYRNESFVKTPSEFINRVPLQFVLNVTAPVPSCSEGQYIPKFVDPTPEHGTLFHLPYSQQQQIVIQAEASAATISGLLFSGPANVTEESQGNGRFILTWTSPSSPTSSSYGRSYPLCFVARADVDSEVRCVVLMVNSSRGISYVPSGAVATYYHTTTNTNGSVTATIRSKVMREICFINPDDQSSTYLEINLYGNCTKTLVGNYAVDSESYGRFCQIETIYSVMFPSTAPTIIYLAGNSILMDFRTRSDTGRSNRPPLITAPPVLRIVKNCERYYKVLVYDEDGDLVRICSVHTGDCYTCSNMNTYGTAFCSIPYSPALYDYIYEQPYPLSGIVLKDFPRGNITLTQTDGSTETKTPSNSISELSSKITLNLDGPAPSCTDGVYLPQFVSPTPEFGSILYSAVGQTLQITIRAEASVSTVSELLFSGPHEMQELMVRKGEFLLTWSPSETEAGQSHPVCFVIDALDRGRRYQTEPRCVIVKVELETQLNVSSVCGKAPLNTNTRIVGGQTASPGEWPWQVSIHIGGGHICGGSLINDLWVLTSAQCFQSGNASHYTVYLGLQSQQGSNPNAVVRSVVQIIIHPQYNSVTNDNDVALFKMASAVIFTDYIVPVCLAAPDSTFYTNTSSWVTGWGYNGSGVLLPSQDLMEVQVPVVGNRQCQCNYLSLTEITDNMICAGQAGKDSCEGDAGGPMVSKQNGRWIQSGVVSFGLGCALDGFPGVYARVSQYQSFINHVITTNQPGYITYTSPGTDSDLSVSCADLTTTTHTPNTTTTRPPQNSTPAPPPNTQDYYYVVADVGLTSLKTLTAAEIEYLLQQLKVQLVSLGLPSDIAVSVLNVTSTGVH